MVDTYAFKRITTVNNHSDAMYSVSKNSLFMQRKKPLNIVTIDVDEDKMKVHLSHESVNVSRPGSITSRTDSYRNWSEVSIYCKGINYLANFEFNFRPCECPLRGSSWVARWTRLEFGSGARLAGHKPSELPPLASGLRQCALWTRCVPRGDEASCSLRISREGLKAAGDERGCRVCGPAS